MQEQSYHFKNLILSDKFLDEESELAAVIGVDDNEEPILFDFAKYPHLFIGGDQGCGKSTLIHSIIMSLMQRNTPDKFQFLYFDAKGLEADLYSNSKYLNFFARTPLATLEYLKKESADRLSLLSENKKRTVKEYNLFADVCDDVEYISELFIFIDELSLIMEYGEITDSIMSLLVDGRVTGIHFVISDTNPTLKSVLKIAKEFPEKVLFRFTYADYKALLGKTDNVPLQDDGEIMCFFRTPKPVHGQASFVGIDEIKTKVSEAIEDENRVLDKHRESLKYVNFDNSRMDIIHTQAFEEFDTEYLRDVAIFAAESNEVTTVDIQKKFNLGYARASRIIDQLEEKGIVGPSNGARPRQIIISDVNLIKAMFGEEVDFDTLSEDDIDEKEEASQPKTGNALFNAIYNNETVDAKDYPEIKTILKELDIIDLDNITDTQKVVISDAKQKALIFEISEHLADTCGDITLTFSPSSDNSETEEIEQENRRSRLKEKIIQLIDNRYFLPVIAILVIAMFAIYTVLNSSIESIAAFAIVAFVLMIVYGAFSGLFKSSKGRKKGIKCNIYTIDNLSDGHTFEYVIADLLKGVGFYNVEVTVGSGDYGIDVVAEYNGESYAIQCKKYSNKVGVSAVQEAYSGRKFYNCNYAVVVTNNYFTPAAQNLAQSTGVILWDRNKVKKLLRENGGYVNIGSYGKKSGAKKTGGCFSVIVWLIILAVFFSVIDANDENKETTPTTTSSSLHISIPALNDNFYLS